MRKKILASIALALLILIVLVAANFPSHPLDTSAKVDKIVVSKSTHTMTLYVKGEELKVYKVALGRGDGSAKQREGDHQTPEGMYIIDSRKLRSRFHKALHVSYPNAQDKAVAARLNAPPGGDIMVHGIERGLGWLGRLHRTIDWTDGCIAVTDTEVDEIWNAAPAGTPIEIRH